ncbi:MAG: thiamine pyrophosphate-binding protein [bacterium]|nr:thiamine pyrophosphate-binding protein [bacterium]
MNVIEYLIKNLENLGITDVFGVAGDYNFDILYAIKNNPKIKFYNCTNELNAGYAADGYARQKGYGALVTTYGVGELSAINAIAGAMAENVPIFNIVGAPSTNAQKAKKVLHHTIENQSFQIFENSFEPIVETTAFLNRDNAKMEIDRLLKVFVKEKKPVYLAIPSDIALMEISAKCVDYFWSSNVDTLNLAVEKILNKINKAYKPVILADILIKRYDSVLEFKEFVEKSAIPVTNLLMGANIVDYDCKTYLGGYFAEFENPLAEKYINNMDCLISIGVIYSDLNSCGNKIPFDLKSHIYIAGNYTVVENERFENIKMQDVLNELSKKIEPKEFQVEKLDIGYNTPTSIQQEFNSEYIYARLQEFLKDNDNFIVETGTAIQGVAKMKFSKNVNIFTQNLWASIGWATPATLGVCVAASDKRTILVTGDGAHQMTAMELGTILRYNFKPIIIVINNDGYLTERLLCINDNDEFNNINKLNYSKFSRTFESDIWSTRVNNSDDFDKALRVTQIMDKLCYIEVCTKKDDSPELSKKILGSFNKYKNPSQKSSSDIKIKEESSFNYSTTIHESLRED